MKKYTVKDAKAYVTEYMEEIMENYKNSKNIPDYLRSKRLEEVWQSGCWMNSVLIDNGASDDQLKQIGFAQGQRSLFDDPWRVAVEYANHFIKTKKAKEAAGSKLSNKILKNVSDDKLKSTIIKVLTCG